MDAEPPTPATGETFQDADAFGALLEPGRRLLGLDLGTKTIGLALSDVGRSIASSLETIRRKKFTFDLLRLM